MLGRCDAAGGAVDDDADRLPPHPASQKRREIVAGLCYAVWIRVRVRSGQGPRPIVCLTFDFDTQSGFIARGMTSATALSRGEFGLLGAQRILALLKAYGMRATWFVPGFTIESHPRACEAVVRDGHEVAHHSW